MAIGKVTFSGMASGLPSDLVDQLMASQQTRLKAFQRDKDFYSNQSTTFNELESKMLALETKAKELQDTSAWSPHTVSSSDEDRIAITADSTALSSNHTIYVGQLATYNTVSMNSGMAQTTDPVNAAGGTFSFDYNGSTLTNTQANQTINIAVSATDTLADLASAINGYDYTSGAGVSASVLYDGTANGYRLILTAKDSGALDGATGEAAKRITNIDSNGLIGGAAAFTSNTPLDAKLVIDGIQVSSSSNQVTTALSGVTLNLKQITTNTGFTDPNVTYDATSVSVNLSIQDDKTALKTTLNGFVESFNGIIDYVNQHKEDTLSGETLTRGIISQIRSVLNTKTGSSAADALTPFSTLAEMGLRTDQKTGKISFNSSSLDAALSTDFNSITKLFTAKHTSTTDTFNEGIAHRMADLIDSLTSSTDGAVTGKKDGLKARIDRLDKSITRENARLELVRESLTKKFSNLEQMISKMNGASGSMLSTLQKM